MNPYSGGVIRVFPRRTALTPDDGYAFVGNPPMMRPEADKVHVSATFTWDIPEARRLSLAWGQYYDVELGGPAFDDSPNGFVPGMYLREGVTFTTRGCNNQCPWCLVPKREGKLSIIRDFAPGYIIQDNNVLQAGRAHFARVCDMLRQQRKAAIFSGGLDATLVDDWVAEEISGIRVDQVFLACDTEGALRPLQKAVERLSFLGRQKTRCYVLIAFGGETLDQAEARLRRVWEIGAMPFAQLYKPPKDHVQEYGSEWRNLARTWSRPAAMKSLMRE